MTQSTVSQGGYDFYPNKTLSKYFTYFYDQRRHSQDEDEPVYDAKTIWGSDLVKFAVDQTNIILELEEVLADSNFLFLCLIKPQKEDEEDTTYDYLVYNERGKVIFYCERINKSPSACSLACECQKNKFGFRLLNANFKEVLYAVGHQCCYSNGVLKISCGSYNLGKIQERRMKKGGRYILMNPDGSQCLKLQCQEAGKWYDVIRAGEVEGKVGELRQKPQYYHKLFPNMLYGLSMDTDLPTHEKHLLMGASLLLLYQKFDKWNNSRRFMWACLAKFALLLIVVCVIAVAVVLVYV